jgi:hypothetical protein
MASLESVRDKIFRAAEHAKGLEPELLRYFETNPGKMVLEPDSPTNDPFFKFVPKEPIPTRFGIIVGDCLQNLRSSLDYLVWELVLAANNQPGKHHMFPVCSTPEFFKEALSKRKRLEGIHPDAIAEIDALQPYHLGQDWEKAVVAVIDDIANTNKHRRVPLTMLRGSRVDNMTVVEINGELWTHGSISRFDENAKIRPNFAATEQVQMEAQLFAGITFDEGAAKGMEVTSSLNIWMLYVLQDVVPRFERFFH